MSFKTNKQNFSFIGWSHCFLKMNPLMDPCLLRYSSDRLSGILFICITYESH